MPLSPGTRIGVYEITGQLGAGGMGEVYRARDTKLNRDVAVKVLPETYSRDPDHYARFQREAQALAALNHPNIAAIYGLEENALIMELVEGETLRTPLPIDTALRYARQIAEALEYAHDRNIIHRDLKPANVMITREGVVKVLDFGLAKVVTVEPQAPSPNSPTLTMRATEVGLIMGTASYMSPEQASGMTVDKRADIWSFGVVLWEMLCGGMLFQGQTVSHTLADVIKGDIDLSKIPAGALRDLVGRCLDRDVKMRLRDIGEARVAIANYKPGRVAAVEKQKTSWLPWAAAAAFALALAGFVAFREKPVPPQTSRFEIDAPQKHVFNNRPMLSPDGRMIAFSATHEDGSSRVWIRQIDSLEARPLAGTEGAQSPVFWSPDNKSIAFSGATLQQLKRIDIAGGPAQTLCGSRTTAPTGSWGSAGIIVYRLGNDGLYKVPAAGGECSPVTKLDGTRKEVTQSAPVFLPDGRNFLYLRKFANPEEDGLFAGSLDKKPEEQSSVRLVATAIGGVYASSRKNPSTGYVLYLQQSSLMARPFDPARFAFTGDALRIAERVSFGLDLPNLSASVNGHLAYRHGSDTGTERLVWYDRNGKLLQQTAKPGEYVSVALSPDGTKAAIEQLAGSIPHIWIHDFVRGSTARATFGDGGESVPVWTPNSESLLYIARRGSISNVFRKAASGAGDEEVVLKLSLGTGQVDISRDSRHLLYTRFSDKTRSDIWLAPLGANQIAEGEGKPFAATEHSEAQGQFSPDGRFVAFRSDASGRREVYVRSVAEGGGQWMISTEGGSQPRWSRDGKELFYLAPNSTLMSIPVNTAPVFRPGVPVPLFGTQVRRFSSGGSGGMHWDVAPDGKRFLFIAQENEERARPVVLVMNWEEGLAGGK